MALTSITTSMTSKPETGKSLLKSTALDRVASMMLKKPFLTCITCSMETKCLVSNLVIMKNVFECAFVQNSLFKKF